MALSTHLVTTHHQTSSSCSLQSISNPSPLAFDDQGKRKPFTPRYVLASDTNKAQQQRVKEELAKPTPESIAYQQRKYDDYFRTFGPQHGPTPIPRTPPNPHHSAMSMYRPNGSLAAQSNAHQPPPSFPGLDCPPTPLSSVTPNHYASQMPSGFHSFAAMGYGAGGTQGYAGYASQGGMSMGMGEQPMMLSEYTAKQIATLQSRLAKKLGPEYIAQRQGPGGGPKLNYIEGWKVINLANEVFGFNGWSSQIVSLTVDYIDQIGEPMAPRYNISITAIIRITLRDGVYHEDVGCGQADNQRGKGTALDKAKKEAVTDGIKRTLKNFGNLLGNCLYDKEYAKEVQKIKVVPKPLDKKDLWRRPEYDDDFQASNEAGPSRPHPMVPDQHQQHSYLNGGDQSLMQQTTPARFSNMGPPSMPASAVQHNTMQTRPTGAGPSASSSGASAIKPAVAAAAVGADGLTPAQRRASALAMGAGAASTSGPSRAGQGSPAGVFSAEDDVFATMGMDDFDDGGPGAFDEAMAMTSAGDLSLAETSFGGEDSFDGGAAPVAHAVQDKTGESKLGRSSGPGLSGAEARRQALAAQMAQTTAPAPAGGKAQQARVQQHSSGSSNKTPPSGSAENALAASTAPRSDSSHGSSSGPEAQLRTASAGSGKLRTPEEYQQQRYQQQQQQKQMAEGGRMAHEEQAQAPPAKPRLVGKFNIPNQDSYDDGCGGYSLPKDGAPAESTFISAKGTKRPYNDLPGDGFGYPAGNSFVRSENRQALAEMDPAGRYMEPDPKRYRPS